MLSVAAASRVGQVTQSLKQKNYCGTRDAAATLSMTGFFIQFD